MGGRIITDIIPPFATAERWGMRAYPLGRLPRPACGRLWDGRACRAANPPGCLSTVTAQECSRVLLSISFFAVPRRFSYGRPEPWRSLSGCRVPTHRDAPPVLRLAAMRGSLASCARPRGYPVYRRNGRACRGTVWVRRRLLRPRTQNAHSHVILRPTQI